MSRPAASVGVAFGMLVALQALRAAGPAPAPSSPAGLALAEDLRSAKPPEDLEVQGLIRFRDPDGRRHRAPLRYRIEVRGAGWRSIYETPGEGPLKPETLVVVCSSNAPNRYEVAPAAAPGAPAGSPTVLVGDDAMVPFAGSDFWLADLGREFLWWPQQRIVEEAKIKMRKGRPCKVLESRNPQPNPKGYTRVRSWIDTKTGGIIMAEAYGPDGKLMKEFEIGGLTKVNGVWELKNMEMLNDRTDSQTIFEFKYERKEKD